MIDHSVGGPPALAAGQKILSFPSDNVAQVEFGGEGRGVIEALEPMAVETSEGHRMPIDLSLSEAGGGFEPATPAVGVKIPKRLGDGVQIPALSLLLTPVDAQSSTLAGSEGSVVGAGVLYANTQTDSDTFVKPTTAGFEADTLLRSVESPEVLYFRVGLPEGASLVQVHGASGPVEIVVEGQTVALVRSPSATDAVGTSVPVSMSVTGDVLALTVASHTGEYQWPIEVDPELVSIEDNATGENSNWAVTAEKPENFGHTWHGSTLELWALGGYNDGERDIATYLTQGESKIYKVEADTVDHVAKGKAILGLAHAGKYEAGAEKLLLMNGEKEERAEGSEAVCASSGCPESGGSNGNSAIFEVEAIEPNGDEPPALIGDMWDPRVYIVQEKAPEVSLNTGEAHPVKDPSRENVAYGSGKWLTPTFGAFEFTVHDPGIGLSRAGISEMGGSYRSEEPIHEEGKCRGVQCQETFSDAITYSPEMAEGEDEFEMYGEDLAGLFGYIGFDEGHPIIKVDAKPPYDIGFTGMPEEGAEITATPHTLTVHATDGTKPTVSSGVKSIEVAIDGGPQSILSGTSCSPGECTVSGKYALAAENLSEGVHRLVVTAIDNAGNTAASEFTFDVRHGSPVSVGPGSVDPTTGQFKLSATDVSLAGSGGVSRVYQSRNLSIGSEGPLGPQWAISLGGGEGLTALPNGSVVLSGPSGGTTTFTLNSKGEFEAPLGDGNLKIEAKEKESGKGVSEYLLIDASAGTTTRFTQPEGTESTIPAYTNQFGNEADGLTNPTGVAVALNGDVWVADYANNRVLQYSAAGALLGAYGGEGSAGGDFAHPRDVAVDQSNGNVFVADEGNNRIDELSSSGKFIRMFGWNVTPNHLNRLEVCGFDCSAGTPGSGVGQFNAPTGVAVDASGDVWVADYGNDRIEEFTEEGGYIQEFGTEGTGEVQFKGPMGIAFSGGNLYVVEYGNNRVQELTTAGKYVSQFGKAGSGGGEFQRASGHRI